MEVGKKKHHSDSDLDKGAAVHSDYCISSCRRVDELVVELLTLFFVYQKQAQSVRYAVPNSRPP